MMPAMARGAAWSSGAHEKLSEIAHDLTANEEHPAATGRGSRERGRVPYVREALPNASVFKPGMVHPLPLERIRALRKRRTGSSSSRNSDPSSRTRSRRRHPAQGKSLFPEYGELSANLVAEKLAGVSVKHSEAPELPGRPPVMCPGCPHRAVYYLLNKLGLTATGDIGCYTLGALPPLQGIDTCLCMGASIPMALGMEKARGKGFARRLVAVIGDSTFVHSGITGLIEAAYAGGTFTVLILDNATTGMTGHQNHPATGYDIRGEAAPRLDLEAVGVRGRRQARPGRGPVRLSGAGKRR